MSKFRKEEAYHKMNKYYRREVVERIITDDRFVLIIFESGKRLRLSIEEEEGFFSTKIFLKGSDC